MSDAVPVSVEPKVGAPRLNGIVISIFQDNGFGFIRGNDRITRYFHAKDVEPRVEFDLMDKGQTVSFTPVDMGVENPAMKKGNGLRAAQVRRM